MQNDREECWKVVHADGPLESVYLVTARNKREAREQVKDVLYKHACEYGGMCKWSIELFRPDGYFLYAINRATGEMSPSDVSSSKRMCVTCLGSVPG